MYLYVELALIALFLIIAAVILLRALTARYNTAYAPRDEKILGYGVMMAMDYRDLLVLLNLLADLHAEIKRPFFLRFMRYPFSREVQEDHRRIATRFYQTLETLEVSHRES